MFTFHVIGLPHTQVVKEENKCAYTTKVLRFCNMMKSLGHDVYLYGGGDKTDADCTQFISCISSQEQEKYFGQVDTDKDFYPIEWDSNLPYWKIMNHTAIAEISKRIKKTDFICLIGGDCQKVVADAFPINTSVEFGVGYKGVFSKFRVFESYSFMHYVYGLKNIDNGLNYDIVIPNYYDVNEFPFSDKREDYFLFIGRLVGRKGANIAVQACEKYGAKLIMAGQGVIERNGQMFKSNELSIDKEHVTHIGSVDIQKRGELMSKARAVFVQTQYIGPFEGVHIESNLCGVPVITTDWGVFCETVKNGYNGFRTRTMGEILYSMDQCDKMDIDHRKKIQNWAVDNFSLDRVKMQYQYYFEQLMDLWSQGYYSNWSEGIKNNRYSEYARRK